MWSWVEQNSRHYYRKIKIRTSSWHEGNLNLCHDEVRILIFDDPAGEKQSQRPQSEFSTDRVILCYQYYYSKNFSSNLFEY